MRKFTNTTPIQAAELALEESTRRQDRYKSVHAAGCADLIDGEPFEVPAGTINDVLDALGSRDGAETVTELARDMKPCARTALGLN